MKALWRAVLVLSLLASAPLMILQLTLIKDSGTFGFRTDEQVANAPPVTRHVGGVEPNSPAAAVGIRAGDTLPLASVDRDSRVRLRWVLPGDAARYDVRRGSQTTTVALVARHAAPYTLTVDDAIRAFVIYSILVFALLVVVRAWNTENGPLVATMLTAGVVDAAADRMPYVPQTANVLGVWLLGNNAGLDAVTTALGTFLPVMLVGRLVAWRGVAPRIAVWCSGAIGAFVVIYCPISIALQHNGMAGNFTEFANVWLMNALPWAFTAAALLAGYATSPAESRPRLRWIFWGFFPYFLGVGLINSIVAWPPSARWFFSQAETSFVAASILRALELALPIGLFYGVLLRRTIDIGFVFNRAAVYGVLSIVLLSIFVILEYVISKAFLDTSRVGSLVLQLSVALAIGLSARYLHKLVDRFVDRVLFAKRHADESALRRFAREAEAYTSQRALFDRAIDVLRAHSESRAVAIYVAINESAYLAATASVNFPESVDADDELLVKLRRWNEPVDTHDAKTVLPDGMVFPMTARGKLVGALACQTKRDFSAFDPDERESLLEIARALGSAVESLGSREYADDVRSRLDEIRSLLMRQDETVSADARIAP
ncbi:MAG TPA: GAF domain-containing protein [Candidatus Baltobacteraceae bacterium]|nr:GAF domain-containing protein [Candidatus Baltobacteraceae bacterium]